MILHCIYDHKLFTYSQSYYALRTVYIYVLQRSSNTTFIYYNIIYIVTDRETDKERERESKDDLFRGQRLVHLYIRAYIALYNFFTLSLLDYFHEYVIHTLI